MEGPAAPPVGLSRETRIRRDARGRWFDGDVPVEHPSVQRAFDAWLERAEDGRYRLRNDVNWAYVEVEGAPVFVRACALEDGEVRLALSDGRREALDPTSLRQGPDGVLHCTVRGGTLAARFDSHAAVQLSALLDEDAAGPFVTLAGVRHRIASVVDPLA